VQFGGDGAKVTEICPGLTPDRAHGECRTRPFLVQDQLRVLAAHPEHVCHVRKGPGGAGGLCREDA